MANVSSEPAASKTNRTLPPCPTEFDDGCDCEWCSLLAEEGAYFAFLKEDLRACAEGDISGTADSREAGWAA